MLQKRIIVRIDTRQGRLAGDAAAEPASLALHFAEEGADEIMLLDVAGEEVSRESLTGLVRRTAERLFIPLTVGGDIADLEEVGRLLRAGADKVVLDSAAIARPDLIREAAERFGTHAIVVGIDARVERRRGAVSSDHMGATAPYDEIVEDVDWYRVFTRRGAQATDRNAISWASECGELGAGEILLANIDRDDAGEGYDLELTARVVERVEVPVVARGDASGAEQIRDAFVIAGADGILAGALFHDGTVRVADVKRRLAADGVAIRREALRAGGARQGDAAAGDAARPAHPL